jgi:hypothetical protein
LYYFIILAILGFVIGYQIIYKHSYQRPVQLIGDASVKAKGTGYLGNSTNFVVWDAVDVGSSECSPIPPEHMWAFAGML